MPNQEIKTLSFNGVEIPTEEFRRKCLSGDTTEYPKAFMNALAYDYLNRVVRNAQPYEKWPKEIKDKLNSMGIYQENGTGRPIFDGQLELVWKDKADEAEQKANSYLALYEEALQGRSAAYCELRSIKRHWWYRLMTWRPHRPTPLTSGKARALMLRNIARAQTRMQHDIETNLWD